MPAVSWLNTMTPYAPEAHYASLSYGVEIIKALQ
jgi:hypothetical protein